MITKVVLSFAAYGALVVGLPVSSPSALNHGEDVGQEAEAQEAESQEPGPMLKVMTMMKRSQRELRKAIKDPEANKEAILKSLTSMELGAHSAILMVPTQASKIAAEERPAWIVAYKRKMTKLLDSILAMEDAALRTDSEALQAAYKEIAGVKGSGHLTFRDI